MYNLVVVVMAIALAAVAIAGGANYLSNDIGTRTYVQQRASTGISVVSTAILSYSGANHGALPRRGSGDGWRDDLAPYLPHGVLPDAGGLTWSYVDAPGAPRLCLSSTEPSKAILDAMRSVVDRNPATTLSTSCDGTGTNLTATAAISIPARR